MSQLDDTPASLDIPSASESWPPGEPPAGPSIKKPTSRLDQVFNFQIVVFEVYIYIYSRLQIWRKRSQNFFQKVENTLFQVLRNGFNVPGTPFEAMFALPQTPTGDDNVEGSSLENPICLSGIKVDHFRSFLRILYPLYVLMNLSAKFISDNILQHRPNTCRRIWWMGRSAEFSNYVGFPWGSVFALTEVLCALIPMIRSGQRPLANFQTLLNRRRLWKELL